MLRTKIFAVSDARGTAGDPAKAVEYDANPRDRRDLVNRPSAAPIELVQSRYAALIFTHTGTHAN